MLINQKRDLLHSCRTNCGQHFANTYVSEPLICSDVDFLLCAAGHTFSNLCRQVAEPGLCLPKYRVPSRRIETIRASSRLAPRIDMGCHSFGKSADTP
jgi:hypothetical protein